MSQSVTNRLLYTDGGEFPSLQSDFRKVRFGDFDWDGDFEWDSLFRYCCQYSDLQFVPYRGLECYSVHSTWIALYSEFGSIRELLSGSVLGSDLIRDWILRYCFEFYRYIDLDSSPRLSAGLDGPSSVSLCKNFAKKIIKR